MLKVHAVMIRDEDEIKLWKLYRNVEDAYKEAKRMADEKETAIRRKFGSDYDCEVKRRDNTIMVLDKDDEMDNLYYDYYVRDYEVLPNYEG